MAALEKSLQEIDKALQDYDKSFEDIKCGRDKMQKIVNDASSGIDFSCKKTIGEIWKANNALIKAEETKIKNLEKKEDVEPHIEKDAAVTIQRAENSLANALRALKHKPGSI